LHPDPTEYPPVGDYTEGAVKQDPATKIMARRTMLDGDGEQAWQVFRFDAPPHYVAHRDVAHWPDMVPGAPLTVVGKPVGKPTGKPSA
jgi:hypothetical protein